MTTTVTLAVSDQFSAPLDSYAQKVGVAEAATAEMAFGMSEADVAATTLANSETEASTSASAMATANSVVSSGMIALAGAGIAVGAAMGVAKAAYDNTVGSAMALGDEVRKLQFETGASAESASKLAYAADITGVGVDSLSRGINIATRALASNKSLGIEPNIDGLAKLSDMYLQIEDPIQRNAFLLHEFGRSGADLAPLMALGSAGIRALGDQATITGNVISQGMTTQLHELSVQTNQLQADTKGLGVELGTDFAPAAQKVVDGGLNWVHTLDLIIAGQKNGSLTTEQAALSFIDLTNVFRPLKDTWAELAPTLQLVQDQEIKVSDASDRAGDAAKYLKSQLDGWDNSPIPLFFSGMADNVGRMTDRFAGAAVAARTLSDAEEAAFSKQMDHAVMVGVGGQIAVNEANYQATIDKNASKIADLTQEIDKYTAANGQAYTVVTKGTASQEDYNLAVERASLSQSKYEAALAGTVDKQGKVHQASALTLEGMRIAAESAQNAVDKLAQKMGSSSSGTADYTTKIAEDQAALDKLTLANSQAEDAMHKANKEFVFQQAAAGLTGQALLDVSLKMGMIDKPTYDAEVATITATKAFNDGKITLSQLETQLGLVVDGLNGVPPAADPIPDVLKPAIDSWWKMHDAAMAAGQGVMNINEQMAAAHDKTITFTVNYVDNHTQHYGDQSGDPNAGNQYGGGTTTTNGGGGGNSSGGHGGNYGGGNSPTVHVHVNGPVSSVGAAAALGSVLAQQVRAQGLAGAATMGQ